jgi:hypothetical protein
VHNWDETISNLGQIERCIDKLVEVLLKSLEILEVLVGFESSDVDLLLELAESASLCRLVLLQELEHLLDALTGELFADGVQVGALVFPEVDFGKRIRVHGLLEGLLGVLTELSLDLFGPVADSVLEHGGLVLGRGLLRLGHVRGGQRQGSPALDQAEGDLGVGEELMELLHEVLADQVGPADLVEGVSQNGKEDFLAGCVEVAEGLSSDFHVDHFVFNARREVNLSVLIFLRDLLAGFDEQQGLPLDSFGIGRHRGHGDHVCA